MRRRILSNLPLGSGFSLIEISIVLVVIGLITGAVVVGNNIYQNAKLMTIISDAGKFRADMESFKDKYEYYPGDFPNATSLWTAMTSPAACDTTGDASNNRTSSTPVAATCDGRGNGFIGMYNANSTLFPTAGADMRELREKFYVWQHLSLAGYLEGSFSGHSTAANNNTVTPGINIPQTDYSERLGFTIQYWPTIYATQSSTRTWPVQGSIGHLFSWSANNAGLDDADLIKSRNARIIDNKVDDGLPFSGKIFVQGRDGGNFDNCTTGTSYKVDDDYQCAQYWRNFLEE